MYVVSSRSVVERAAMRFRSGYIGGRGKVGVLVNGDRGGEDPMLYIVSFTFVYIRECIQRRPGIARNSEVVSAFFSQGVRSRASRRDSCSIQNEVMLYFHVRGEDITKRVQIIYY